MTTQVFIYRFPLSKTFLLKTSEVNWKIFLVFGFCLVLLLSTFYVFQTNEIIKNSYLIKENQKILTNLISENKKLEMDLAQMHHLENIEKKSKELNFKIVKTIKYIQILDSSLAKK